MSQAESNFTRRTALAVLGAALIAAIMVSPLQAAEPSGEAAAVAKVIEALNAAMVAGNENEMSALVDDHLTYGHSYGRVQDKAAFLKYLIGPKAPGKLNWIKLSNQTIDVIGHIALVRHVFDSENVRPDGKIVQPHIAALQVWKKEKGGWKLLARQACPLDQ